MSKTYKKLLFPIKKQDFRPVFLSGLSELHQSVALDLSALALDFLDGNLAVRDESLYDYGRLLRGIDSLYRTADVGCGHRFGVQHRQDAVFQDLFSLELLSSLLGCSVASLFGLVLMSDDQLFELCDNFLVDFASDNCLVSFDLSHCDLLSPTLWRWAPVTFKIFYLMRGYFSLTFYIYYTRIFRTFQIILFSFRAEGRSFLFYSSLTFYIYYSEILSDFQILFCFCLTMRRQNLTFKVKFLLKNFLIFYFFAAFLKKI